MIPIYRPSIRRLEMDAVLSSLVDDRLSDGPVSRDFAKELKDFFQADFCSLLRDYERGIALALRSLGLEAGRGVLVSPLAPASYARVIEEEGYKPVLADVTPDSMTLDISRVQELLQHEDVGALVADSPFGYAPSIAELRELGVPIIEDVSSNLGFRAAEDSSGIYGDILLLRMEAGDVITVGGGMAVLSTRRKYSSAMRGIIENWPVYRFLSDMNSSLGRSQLKNLPESLEKREEIYRLFISAIRKGRHTTPVPPAEGGEHVHHYFPVFVRGPVKEVQNYAKKKGVATFPAFADSIIAQDGNNVDTVPGAKQIYKRCLLFPLYPLLSTRELETMSRILSSLP